MFFREELQRMMDTDVKTVDHRMQEYIERLAEDKL